MNHQPKKRFGQNFLTDQSVIQQIIHLISTHPVDHLIEIGPGRGALTQHLPALSKQLDIIELDKTLYDYLMDEFITPNPNTHLYKADALTFDYSSILRPNQTTNIVGNLPYNISTPLLFHLLKYKQKINHYFFMLQKEVVDRLAASPNTKDYGRLSVMTQYHCNVRPTLDVPPQAFNPVPKVHSAFVQLSPYKTLPHTANDLDFFEQLIKTAFAHRRKTLNNNLSQLLDEKLKANCPIDLSLRAQALNVADFVVLSNYLTSS